MLVAVSGITTWPVPASGVIKQLPPTTCITAASTASTAAPSQIRTCCTEHLDRRIVRVLDLSLNSACHRRCR